MVSDYSDAGQERWLADDGIDLLRGSGRLAGVGVVDAARPSGSSSRRSRPLLSDGRRTLGALPASVARCSLGLR
jgi:hypothetical protein